MRPPIYPVVLPDNTSPVRAEAGLKNATKLVDFNVHTADTCGCHDSIQVDVEDTWICKLNPTITFYVGVKTSTLIKHLQKHCGGLHNITNTATNEKADFEQLVATNSKQEATIDTQASIIKHLADQVKTVQDQVHALKKSAGTPNFGPFVPEVGGYC